jgi:AcrR family transcriptional regulator
MPKISDQQRQARRDQILAATWRCFARKGIHATSMEEIIRETNLSAGAVYLYFKSKDELIFAAISSYIADLRGLLMPILMTQKPLPPLAFIYEISSAIAKHTRRADVDLNVVILMCWSEAQSNKDVQALVTGFHAKYREALVDIIRQWQKRKDLRSGGNPEDLAKALLAFFLGFIAQSALLGGLDPETVTRGMDGVLGNLKTVKPSARKR